ncbi:MAG: hypothetical protein KIT17_06305 [Rubrivivax sp.]|nr:hypothetical protein [Rubrivivax sp.]
MKTTPSPRPGPTARSAIPAAIAACAAAMLLAACGGSDGYDDAPAEDPTQVPASATSSTSAWFMFARALALAPNDTGEPLLLTGVAEMPTSESEEAATVSP